MSHIYAPWSLCICQWCINVWCIRPWSLRLDYAACVCDAYIHDAAILSRKDGGTNQRWSWHACVVYDACIHDVAYLSCMYKPRLWCIYTLCMYVLCIYICSLIMYAQCIYICSLIMMHMCMMHTSVIFNPWLCCMCVWCGWNFVTNQPTNQRTRRF